MSSTERAREWTFIAIITLVIWLTVDFLFGAEILRRVAPDRINLEHAYRVAHPVYHHELAANFDGLGQWGPIVYRVCTDPNGFKASCEKKKDHSKNFDVAFIGDSFTEGVGLPYEQTFVGQIASAHPEWKIANMAVASYAPSIYLAKIKKHLADGFRFKELVVFIDVSDIQDDGVNYTYSDGVVTMRQSLTSSERTRNIAHLLFPLTASSFLGPDVANSASSSVGVSFLDPQYSRSGWTFNENIDGFGEVGVNGAIVRSLGLMTQLHEILTQHGIRLSVGVYPWPGQILHDSKDSRHVKIWREFCETRCNRFYDAFPAFFAYADRFGKEAAINRLYINGDVHHSVEGARLIAEDFLAKHRINE